MKSSKSSQAERLQKLKARLAKARDENLQAVADEVQRDTLATSTEASKSGATGDAEDSTVHEHIRKRRRVAEREQNSVLTKSMRHRLSRMERDMKANPLRAGNSDEDGAERDGEHAELIQYGGAGKLQRGAADRVVAELEELEQSKMKYRRKPDFDEDSADIGFINDPNRKFIAILDQHYDKYDSVRVIKDSLERGTALP